MNVVLVIVDTLRQDHVGCYGNEWIRTPYLDALANESVRFTRVYPESLPTLQVRRALHTGHRVFPFPDHRDVKGGYFTGALGWAPIREDRDTMAEILQSAGYRTALITDTYHQFKPSMNFHRGFDEWHWIRGQETDPYRSGPPPSLQQVEACLPPSLRRELRGIAPEERFGRYADFVRYYLTNVSERRTEEDYFPARVFREAANWLDRNRDAEHFFLTVDSFDPHEPWDPPSYYRELYQKEEASECLSSLYGAADQLDRPTLERLRASYAGEVTLVDRWIGYLLEKLDYMGRMKDTIIAVISDHGHCVGEHNIVGKQGHPLTREVADLVLLLRHPEGTGAGEVCNALSYNYDLSATLLASAGVTPPTPMEGKNLWPVVTGEAAGYYDHITCAWGPLVMVRNERWWYNAYLWGEAALLYDLEQDPHLDHNVAQTHPDIGEQLRQLAVADAGGSIPDYIRSATAGPGCSPLLK